MFNQDPLYLYRNCQISAHHFESSQFADSGVRKQLPKTAVPNCTMFYILLNASSHSNLVRNGKSYFAQMLQTSLSIFFQFRLYDHCSASSLFTPSQSTLKVIQKCRTVFSDTFEHFRHIQGIMCDLLSVCVDEACKMPEVGERSLSDCWLQSVERVKTLPSP